MLIKTGYIFFSIITGIHRKFCKYQQKKHFVLIIKTLVINNLDVGESSVMANGAW